MSEQKYRQRGYKDDDWSDSRERRPAAPKGPRDRTLRPGGRGLGKPTATVFRCAVCGHRQSALIELESVCGKCGTDLHTCTHCAYFDTGSPNQCRKPGVAYVASKAKRNGCEEFEAKATQEFAKEQAAPSSGRAAFDALFKT